MQTQVRHLSHQNCLQTRVRKQTNKDQEVRIKGDSQTDRL